MNHLRDELSWLLYHGHRDTPSCPSSEQTKKQVQALRSAVEEGKYRIPAQVVAEHFLVEQLLFQELGDPRRDHAPWPGKFPGSLPGDAD